jgi:hypothetical protein
MATITYDAEGPGKGAFAPLSAQGARGMKIITGKYSFDNAYPAGGEDISEIFNFFAELKGMIMESPLGSAGTGKHARIDFTAKKAMLYTNAATPADVGASDQSAAANLRFIAWGV